MGQASREMKQRSRCYISFYNHNLSSFQSDNILAYIFKPLFILYLTFLFIYLFSLFSFLNIYILCAHIYIYIYIYIFFFFHLNNKKLALKVALFCSLSCVCDTKLGIQVWIKSEFLNQKQGKQISDQNRL